MRPKLEGCYYREEDLDSSNAKMLKEKFVSSVISQDPEYAQIRETTIVPEYWRNIYNKEEGGLLIVVYDQHDRPIGIAGAAMFGTDLWLGFGYIEPEWRGTGLIQELTVLRWRWGLAQGATRAVCAMRRKLSASMRMSAKAGYRELDFDNQPWWNEYSLATHFNGRSISHADVSDFKVHLQERR